MYNHQQVWRLTIFISAGPKILLFGTARMSVGSEKVSVTLQSKDENQ